LWAVSLPNSLRLHKWSPIAAAGVEVEMAYPWQTQTVEGEHNSATRDANPLGRQFVPIAVGLVSLLVTEFMHYLLVPDLGRVWERLLAEGLSAVVVAWLTAGFIRQANQRRDAALLRMQVIAETNHHIRNALAAISFSTDAIQNPQCIQVISESVERIEWTLREVLPRNKPLPEEDRNRMLYFELPREADSTGPRRGSMTVNRVWQQNG
jgi:signal transduction histidine kinase